MATQSISGPSGHGPDPRPLFDLATGFMRAKHIFVAAESGVFETLGEGSATLEELAVKLGCAPQKIHTPRIYGHKFLDTQLPLPAPVAA